MTGSTGSITAFSSPWTVFWWFVGVGVGVGVGLGVAGLWRSRRRVMRRTAMIATVVDSHGTSLRASCRVDFEYPWQGELCYASRRVQVATRWTGGWCPEPGTPITVYVDPRRPQRVLLGGLSSQVTWFSLAAPVAAALNLPFMAVALFSRHR